MSSTDLQQFNGTPVFPPTADVGTNADEYLIPIDGPVITAQSNNGDEGPVYPSLTRVKNYVLGLRGAIIGDFAGAVRKTLKSLQVDGSGGATSALGPGQIKASSDITTTLGDLIASLGGLKVFTNVEAQAGNIVADVGAVQAANPSGQGVISGDGTTSYVQVRSTQVNILGTNTGPTDANPPQGTSISNQLRAINIPKCKTFIDMQAVGVISSFDGCGIQSVVINGGDPHLVEVTFKDAFDNTHFTVKSSGVRGGPVANYMIPMERTDLRTTTKCFMEVLNFNSGMSLDLSATAISFSVEIDGQQTT